MWIDLFCMSWLSICVPPWNLSLQSRPMYLQFWLLKWVAEMIQLHELLQASVNRYQLNNGVFFLGSWSIVIWNKLITFLWKMAGYAQFTRPFPLIFFLFLEVKWSQNYFFKPWKKLCDMHVESMKIWTFIQTPTNTTTTVLRIRAPHSDKALHWPSLRWGFGDQTSSWDI